MRIHPDDIAPPCTSIAGTQPQLKPYLLLLAHCSSCSRKHNHSGCFAVERWPFALMSQPPLGVMPATQLQGASQDSCQPTHCDAVHVAVQGVCGRDNEEVSFTLTSVWCPDSLLKPIGVTVEIHWSPCRHIGTHAESLRNCQGTINEGLVAIAMICTLLLPERFDLKEASLQGTNNLEWYPLQPLFERQLQQSLVFSTLKDGLPGYTVFKFLEWTSNQKKSKLRLSFILCVQRKRSFSRGSLMLEYMCNTNCRTGGRQYIVQLPVPLACYLWCQ